MSRPNMTIVPLMTGLLLVVLLIGTIYLCSTNDQNLIRYERIGSGDILPPLSKSQLYNFTESAVKSGLVNCESNEGCCAICLDDFEKGDRIRTLLCYHFFHSICIDNWLTSKTRTCPMCNVVIESTNNKSRTWRSLRWWWSKSVLMAI